MGVVMVTWPFSNFAVCRHAVRRVARVDERQLIVMLLTCDCNVRCWRRDGRDRKWSLRTWKDCRGRLEWVSSEKWWTGITAARDLIPRLDLIWPTSTFTGQNTVTTATTVLLFRLSLLLQWRGSATGRALDLRSVGRAYSRQRCVTLGELFTPMSLCHQAV